MKLNNIQGIENEKRIQLENSIKNPYTRKLKKQVTIQMENNTIEYFKQLASETDIPYQKLINLFLRDCVQNKKKPTINWTK